MLSLYSLGNVNGSGSSHLGNDCVTGKVFLALNVVNSVLRADSVVEYEVVEAHSEEVSRVAVISGLVCMRVPVCSQCAYRILINVFFISSRSYNVCSICFAVVGSIIRIVHIDVSVVVVCGIIRRIVVSSASCEHRNYHKHS